MKFSTKLLRFGMFFLVLIIAGTSSPVQMTAASAKSVKYDTISWDVEQSHPYVQKGSQSDEFINIKLTGRKDVPFIARTPVNLVLVIDRSGSMSDKGKISYAKEAAKEIITRLGQDDRLSIVAYSTQVHVLYPMQTLSNKDAAISAVDSLYPTHSTNLSGGLIKGINQLQSVKRSGYINRVILLSDGLANEGITDIGELSLIASRASERGIQITTMGLGLDFDENLMMCVAQYGAGNYYFIESPYQLAAIFHKEFGQLSRTIAKSPVITITPGPGVTLREVYGYKHSTTSDGKIKIKLGDMFAGQERDILLKMHVPTDKQGKKGLVTASLGYEDLLNNNVPVKHEEELSYNITSDKNLVTKKENKEVTARWVSVNAAVDLDQAISQYESGNADQAVSTMNGAYERLRIVNRSKYRTQQTVEQENELRDMIHDFEAMPPPSVESDEGKSIIKKQKANSLQYQQ